MSDGIYWHNKALALERRLDEVLMRSQAREDENARLRSELSGAREWATGQAEVIERLKKESQWNGHSAKEWSLALQGLTPQGSEYASDPQACVDYVRKDRASAHESRIRAVEVRRERDALKALAGTLVDALEVAKEALESLVVPSALTHSTLAVHVFQVAEEGGRKVSAALSEAGGLLPKEEGK